MATAKSTEKLEQQIIQLQQQVNTLDPQIASLVRWKIAQLERKLETMKG